MMRVFYVRSRRSPAEAKPRSPGSFGGGGFFSGPYGTPLPVSPAHDGGTLTAAPPPPPFGRIACLPFHDPVFVPGGRAAPTPCRSGGINADAGNLSRIVAGGKRACRIRAAKVGRLGTFSGLAYSGAPMRPGGWYGKVIVDLDGVIIPKQHRPILRQHDHSIIVGHSTSVEVDRKGIRVEGVFSGEKRHVESVVVPARNGFEWEMSIGADPVRTEYLEAGETTTVNGREVTGPLTISRETSLGEISFVPLGADGNTHVSVAARKHRGRLPDCVEGVACVFGHFGYPTVGDDDPDATVFMPGCLAESVRAIRDGRAHFSLRVGHGGKRLASSRDNCLSLKIRGSQLRLKVWSIGDVGRRAVRYLLGSEARGLSVGVRTTDHTLTTNEDGNFTACAITGARLAEIALVDVPAMPGCYLRA